LVLRCFGLEQVHPGIHSLRLELAPLGSVRQYIAGRATARVPPECRLRMARDVARGLAFVHSRGVAHSDLSCRNLFLFRDFTVKIGDFGGAIFTGVPGTAAATAVQGENTSADEQVSKP
jgi:serine/threonine protein kinase